MSNLSKNNNKPIFARNEEQAVLKKLMNSRKAEFVAIYGRRRVGKTYLIRNFFRNEDCIYFQVTGKKNGGMKSQLQLFTQSLQETFYPPGTKLKEPENWADAFDQLTTRLLEKIKTQKVIIFLDELPWLATLRSKFIQTLDHFWNDKWVDLSNLMLITCGSAAAWMLDNLINAKGGLHNRLTKIIELAPLTLPEVKEFLSTRKINYTKEQILELYMVTGGIPLYLDHIERGLSVPQNIDKLCFRKDGLLFNEFNNLYESLFDQHEIHEELIRIIAKSRYGIGQEELFKKAKTIKSGGTGKKKLQELESAGFITSFLPYGHKEKGVYYKVIDEYSLFYLNWIEPSLRSLKKLSKIENYWLEKNNSFEWKTWSGYTFETICYKHISHILKKLNIPLSSEIASWRYTPRKKSSDSGAQIDLLFDRTDGIITLCEIKYNNQPYHINKQKAENLVNKIDVFKKITATKKQLQLVMITKAGISPSMYSEEIVDGVTDINDLFD